MEGNGSGALPRGPSHRSWPPGQHWEQAEYNNDKPRFGLGAAARVDGSVCTSGNRGTGSGSGASAMPSILWQRCVANGVYGYIPLRWRVTVVAASVAVV